MAGHILELIDNAVAASEWPDAVRWSPGGPRRGGFTPGMPHHWVCDEKADEIARTMWLRKWGSPRRRAVKVAPRRWLGYRRPVHVVFDEAAGWVASSAGGG